MATRQTEKLPTETEFQALKSDVRLLLDVAEQFRGIWARPVGYRVHGNATSRRTPLKSQMFDTDCVRDFLLAWWSAEDCGGFDLGDLWNVDPEIVEVMQRVFSALGKYRLSPYQLGYGERFERLRRSRMCTRLKIAFREREKIVATSRPSRMLRDERMLAVETQPVLEAMRDLVAQRKRFHDLTLSPAENLVLCLACELPLPASWEKKDAWRTLNKVQRRMVTAINPKFQARSYGEDRSASGSPVLPIM